MLVVNDSPPSCDARRPGSTQRAFPRRGAGAVVRPDLACSCATIAARNARLLGDAAAAELWLQRATDGLGECEDPWIVGAVKIAATVHALRTGRLDDAEAVLNDALLVLLRAHQNNVPRPRWYSVPLVSVYENLAALARARNDAQGMIRHIEHSRQLHRDQHYPFGEVSALIALGEAYRMAGKTAEAIEANETAWHRLEAMGSPFVLFPWMNLTIIRVQEHQDHEAWVLVEGLLEKAAHYKRAAIQGLARLCRLILLARRGELDGWTVEVERALADLRQSGFVDKDVARCAQDAATLVEPALARPLLELAHTQWQSLGRADEADVVLGMLSASAPPG